MILSRRFITSLLPLGLCTKMVHSMQLSNEPTSYFGGENNQEYLDWVLSNAINSKYPSSVYLPSMDPANGAAIHWHVDSEWLHIAVAVKAAGWVGFGISEAGGMLGADMALFTANRPAEIVDAYVTENRFPVKDECQQDWELVNSSNEIDVQSTSAGAGLLTFEARRKLVTGDKQDKPILQDSDPTFPAHRIIAAWGDSSDIGYHGPNVARGSVRFFGSSDEDAIFEEKMSADADGSFVLLSNNFEIADNEETQYVDFCITRAEIIGQGVPATSEMLNIIGFRPIVSPQSAPYVHHFVVSASTDVSDNGCEDDMDNLVYVWAPGDGPFALPDFLGSALFGEDGYQSFSMEVHYNNPGFISGIIDNSGVEFFYTTKPRDQQLGVLQIGDPFLNFFGTPVGDGLTSHTFECSSGCSETFLSEPVTVIREYLHMHGVGTRMTNQQIRNGEVVRESSVEVWEFDQNGNVAVQQEAFDILPGDSFRTNCYYRGKQDTEFGLGSQEEMCIVFAYYYPVQRISVAGIGNIPWHCGYDEPGLEVCWVEHESFPLSNESQLNRKFGVCDVTGAPTESDSGETSDAFLQFAPLFLSFFPAFLFVILGLY